MLAVQSLGKNARGGRFADAARPAKKIGVRDAILFDGVLEGLRDVFLRDEFVKLLRPPFAGEDLVLRAHGRIISHKMAQMTQKNNARQVPPRLT